MRLMFTLGLAVLSGMDWDRVRRALGICGMQLKDVSIHTGLSAAQLSRQMRDQEHMHVDRFAQLPEEFHRVFAWLTLEDLGVPDYIRRAAPVIESRKRMASMSESSIGGERGAA